MSKLITVPFTSEFLPHVVDYIYGNYVAQGKDLTRLGIVFGGRRPSLFIKRALAKRIGAAYIPPQFFSIDEWMANVAGNGIPQKGHSPLDHSYAIYRLAQIHTPEILQNRLSFAQFLPWASEILGFIEQLDLEDVPLDALNLIKEHAKIGFSIPEDINRLLVHISVLRKSYHEYLGQKDLTTRGHQYLQAARGIHDFKMEDIDELLFCNFFYLHRTENAVIKDLYDRHNVTLIMQGDQRRWPALERIAKTFETPILEGAQVVPTRFNLHLYEAFDSHAQAALVKSILVQIQEPEETVIVVPDSNALLPLLTALGSNLKEFNISMGYPLKRSALYALLELIMHSQTSRSDGLYYARDYLRVLQHPLVKNLNLLGDPSLVRMMIHRIEEVLKGNVLGNISGSLFLNLSEVISEEKIFNDLPDSPVLKTALSRIHTIFFEGFDGITNSAQLAVSLEQFLEFMHTHSTMEQYPLNTQIARRIEDIIQEFANGSFVEEEFPQRDLFRILERRLSQEFVAFTGSPLRGLQILGLFETRALNFKNVIVVDVNEGVLPNLSVYEPLIPREVMIKLNLDRLELEEEIQRYGFMRLISSATHVHLIYQHNHDQVRSRFVEELIWEQEQRTQRLGSLSIVRPAFEASVIKPQRQIPKTAQMLDFLSAMTFSASSVGTYVKNPYDFYTQYILALREKDDLLEDVQSRHIGTFIHSLLEETFKVFLGKKPVIDAEFQKYFYKIYEQRFAEMFGRNRRSDTFLMETVLKTRLDRFLNEEARRCEEVAKIMFIERKFDQVLSCSGRPIRFTYRVDRVDQMEDGRIVIIDYKTGSVDPMPKDAAAIAALPLDRVTVRDAVRSFQLPLYAQYLHCQYPQTVVDAAFYHLRTMKLDFFLKHHSLEPIPQVLAVYHSALEAIMEEIFNPEIPFVDDPLDIQ